MRTIGLALHPTRTDPAVFDQIQAAIAGQDIELLGRGQDQGRLPAGTTIVSDQTFAARVDAVLSLGGDGTMLGAMRLVADRPVPVLGVNVGNLGFLVELQPAELAGALARAAAGDFEIEEHFGLRVSGLGPDLMAFNDVVLTRGRATTMSADLWLGDHRYGYYRGDAVIVATPHGSTAYSFSAGGPVVSPAAPVCVVTPVAPMSGIVRPVVLGLAEVIRFTAAATGDDLPVEIDGTDAGRLEPGAGLTLTLVPGAGQVIRIDAGAHATRNRIKLSLLDLPLRPDQLLELVPPELRSHRPDDDAPR